MEVSANSNSNVTEHPVVHRPLPPPFSAQEDPVDMERLNDFTNGDPENACASCHACMLTQTTEQLGQLETAVRNGSAADVRRLAHSCAGASATCGMRRLVPLLRELEREGFEEKLVNSRQKSFARACPRRI